MRKIQRCPVAAMVAIAGAVLFAGADASAVVTGAYSPPSYSCNGSTTVYTITFPYQATSTITATSTTATGVVTTLVLTTDYSISPSSGSSGTLTLTAGSKCPSGSTLKIGRSTPPTQTTSFRSQGDVRPAAEAAFDKLTEEHQELAAQIPNAAFDFSAGTVTLAGGTTAVTLAGLLASLSTNVLGWGAVGDGTTADAASINAALSAKTGVIYLPPSSTCYNLGTSTLNIGSGRSLEGGGMGGASAGPSCVTYTGTGCAILFDSVSFAALRNIDVQVNSTSATAAGTCLKATTAVAEFNLLENVSIRMTNATRRTAGQVGLLLSDTGNGVFWNTFRRLRTAYWDTSIKLVGGATQGTNANEFFNLMSWGHVTAFRAVATGGGFSVDNVIYGLKCSRSDGTFAGTATCLLLGDDGTNASMNTVYGLVSDQGAPSVCGTIGQAGGSIAGGNVIESDCESGGAITDNNNGTIPNRIYDAIAGATPGRLRLGRLALSNELSLGAIPSTTGDIRLSNNQSIRFRNNANNADLTVLVSDTNDRLQIGSSSAFVRLNNNIVEHGSGTVANSGNERYVHNWTELGRNSANNANRTIWSWGATSDTLVLGDASATAIVNAPSTFASTQNSSTCTLNGASPAVCTATVPSGSHCTANPTGTTAAAASHTLATSVTSTTLTITGANGLTDPVVYHCF